MATPLTAVNRIDFVYVIDGLTHHNVRYCDWDGSTSSPTLARNGGGSAITLQDAADAWANALAQVLAVGDAQTASYTLQEYSSGAWLDRVFGTTDIDSDWTNPRIPASQITLVLRDTDFKFIRMQVFESAQPMPYHFSALGSNTGPLHTFSSRLWNMCYNFDSAGEAGLNCWDWVKSRGNNFLATTAFVGVTGDFNDKVRRARGLT